MKISFTRLVFRVRPNLATLPTQQHPEPAVLASASPSPMTPSEDKIPRLDILDQVNNNKKVGAEKEEPGSNSKYQVKETNLPKLSKAVLSPTSTPRRAEDKENDADSGKFSGFSLSSTGRNLTRTVAVCRRPNAELVQCRKCWKVKCVQPSHQHQNQTVARTKIKTQIKK